MTAETEPRTGFQLTWPIKATPERVFRAWTDPAQLGWFFNDALPRPDEPIEVDLRVGGIWRIMMVQSPDNRYFTGGLFKEIVPGERLVFWWGAVGGWPPMNPDNLAESPVVTLRFQASPGGMTLIMDVDLPQSLVTSREGMASAINAGWTATVDRLARQFAG